MKQGLRRGDRFLPYLTRLEGGRLQPAPPDLEERDVRAMTAHLHGLGGLINFFDRQAAPVSDWGKVLILSPPVLAAVMLEEAARDFPPEGGRPARLAALAEAGQGRHEPGEREEMEALVASESQWQNAWRERLKEAACPPGPPVFDPLRRPELPPGEFPDFRWYLGAALSLGASRQGLLNWAEKTWNEARTKPDGALAPHLGQIMAFLDGLDETRPSQNQLLPLHARYFYEKLLGKKPREAAADRVLVAFQWDDDFISLSAGRALTTTDSPPLLFRLEDETPVSAARLKGLTAILPAASPGPFGLARRFTPEELAEGRPRRLFPEAAMEKAECASALLKLSGLNLPSGRREVAIALELSDSGGNVAALQRAWETRPEKWLTLELSLAEGWFELPDYSIELENSHINISFALPPEIVPAPAAEGCPALRLSPGPLECGLWAALAACPVSGVTLRAEVAGRTDFNLIINGQAQPNTPDAPAEIFGAAPGPGASFAIELPDDGGQLTRLRLSWDENGPEDFKNYFRAYPDFKAISLAPAISAAEGWQNLGPPISWPGRALCEIRLDLSSASGKILRFKLSELGGIFGHAAYPGLLARLSLIEASALRRLMARLARKPRLADLNPPHTPAFSGLSLDYAVSASYGPEVLEHQCPWPEYIEEEAAPETKSLLPHYERPRLALIFSEIREAERRRPLSLYFNLQNLAPGAALPAPAWLGAKLYRDDTSGLQRSGLVGLTLTDFKEDENENGDEARINLKWPGSAPSLALAGLLPHAGWAAFDLAAWLEAGAPERPWPLPAGSISELSPTDDGRPWPAPLQERPSVGGRGRSSASSADFWQDQAEELSHRGQAVLPRDYERLVLREFPEVMAALCLPHTDENLEKRRPGHTAVVVFAPQGGGAGLSPELPAYADDGLLAMIREFLAERASPLVKLNMLQGRFEAIQPLLRGRISPFKNMDEALAEMREILGRAIAPWAYAPAETIFSRPVIRADMEGILRSIPWLLKVEEFRLTGAGGALNPEKPARADLLFYMDAPQIEFSVEGA